MTQEELKEKIRALQVKFDSDVMYFKRLYCDSNNTYKIGDVFTDHMGSISIENIGYHYREIPCCVYYGIELKKDGTPRKDGSKRHAYQSNEKK